MQGEANSSRPCGGGWRPVLEEAKSRQHKANSGQRSKIGGTKQNQGQSTMTISQLTTSLPCLRLHRRLFRPLRCGREQPSPSLRPQTPAAIADGSRRRRRQQRRRPRTAAATAAGGCLLLPALLRLSACGRRRRWRSAAVTAGGPRRMSAASSGRRPPDPNMQKRYAKNMYNMQKICISRYVTLSKKSD